MASVIDRKLRHLIKNFGFKKQELGEIKKMYSGDFFNCEDCAYKRLVKISNELCNEYSTLSGKMGSPYSFFKCLKIFIRKNKIIGLLFPIHGIISSMGENVKVMVGLVDFLGCGFINRGVEFSFGSLVTCENNSIFAVNVKVGDESVEKNGDLIKLSNITIKKDCWICAGVKICGDITIGERCVIGAGAVVQKDIENDSLAVGRPCKAIAKIDKNYSSKKEIPFFFSCDEIKKIEQHVSKLKFKGALKQYDKAIKGQVFNSTNISLGRLFIYTHRLCSELNSDDVSVLRKKEIINILFPLHGQNFKVGKNFYIDLLGTVIAKDNVTILDNVCLAGNLILEDNVVLENNVTIFASSHSVFCSERRVGFSLKNGLYEYTSLGFVKVLKDITISKGATLVPNMVVNKNIPQNSLALNNKIID